MAAGHLSASATLENCAGELFEEVFTGHKDNDLAEWLGTPNRGAIEHFHAPVEGDSGMAGAPADSESTTLATFEEVHAVLYPRAIGTPTDMELID
eukprot:2318731-Pyramimonas_sp.AAC.1